MGLFSFLGSIYQLIVDATKEAFIRILMGILIFLGYVLLSLFIYAVMRRIMVPQKLHVLPVYLQYNPVCGPGSDPFSCPFPQAEFLLNGGKKLLSSGQYYTIALEMEVPESRANQEIGVFMVNLTFYTKDKRFLSTSARPAMIRYKSFLHQTMYTLVFALPLLFGLWEQKQLIDLTLYEQYYEPYGDGALSAKVILQNHGVQVYSSSLTVDANFSGFTYYLYQWPISMSVIVVISIFITLCTCTVLMWVRDVVRDYDLQRRRALQRRRMTQQQQLQGQRAQQQGRQTQLTHAQRAPPITSPRVGGSPSTEESLTGVENIGSEGDTTPTVTPSLTRESSEPKEDTDSELNAVISTLRSLRREMADDMSTTTESSSLDGGSENGEAGGSRAGGGGHGELTSQQLRRRTGQ